MKPKISYASKVSVFLVPGILALAGIWLGGYISWNISIKNLQDNSQQQLEQFISHIDAHLARFQFIPQLISKNQLLVDQLKEPMNSSRINVTNYFLEEMNTIIGASDTYLMDDQGLTLAASNWQSEQSFINKNFSFRPYFTEAIKGNLGRYFALGSTSGQRCYYFAYPIRYAAKNLGVIVVKMDLSDIELQWSKRKIQFIISDPQGIIFITTQPEWLYQSIKPLSPQARKKITLSQRYSGVSIKNLDLKILRSISADTRIVSIDNDKKAFHNNYLSIQKNMPRAGWDIRILTPLNDVRNNRIITLMVLFLTAALVLLMIFLARQKRKRQQERESFQQEAKKQLEDQVIVRTTDLRHEIEEHKRTQNELIQTAKLAVLGQMSASISHELNNPLAAIQTYAENARQFLGLNKTVKVDENLSRIIQLSNRMSKISSQLKFFSRKSINSMEQINVQAVIQSAVDIVSTQDKNSHTIIHIKNHAPELKALADIIQLEQILINLINNALQAVENKDNGKITIATEVKNNTVLIHVEDNGPGIDSKFFQKIFDPFFTTKKMGLGLGLSISARIMKCMNGQLLVSNRDEGGAKFTISLLVSKEVVADK